MLPGTSSLCETPHPTWISISTLRALRAWTTGVASIRPCPLLQHFRQAEAAGISSDAWASADLTLLAEPSELDLVRKMAAYPDELLSAALERAPSRIASADWTWQASSQFL